MSLSFVSSAVLSSSDGVSHNEERQIESKEVQALRGKQPDAKPLFDQLRTNKEEEEAKREEFQRSIMRGTLALDEEDCAHLDSIQKQRDEREAMVKADTEQELALFRAAREERTQSQLVVPENDDIQDTKEAAKPKGSSQDSIVKPKPKMMAPVIKAKRRRRQPSDNMVKDRGEKEGQSKKQKLDNETTPVSDTSRKEKDKGEEQGLGGLLGGYGSSSDDSD